MSPGDLLMPSGIASDRHDRLFVADRIRIVVRSPGAVDGQGRSGLSGRRVELRQRRA